MNASQPGAAGTLLVWLALVFVETTAQIAMRLSGDATGPIDATPASFFAALASPWLWVALGCYLAGFVAWMRILQRSDLSQAFPTSAIVFVAVMLGSWLVLGESIGWRQWLGDAAIVAGILLLGGESTGEPAISAAAPDGAAASPPLS
jgi:drug/metabolite transporter (DMT)-like permease